MEVVDETEVWRIAREAAKDVRTTLNLSTRGEAMELGRIAARTEIASLCGLVLRRLQFVDDSDVVVGGTIKVEDLSRIFGEALRDFSATDLEPGE